MGGLTVSLDLQGNLQVAVPDEAGTVHHLPLKADASGMDRLVRLVRANAQAQGPLNSPSGPSAAMLAHLESHKTFSPGCAFCKAEAINNELAQRPRLARVVARIGDVVIRRVPPKGKHRISDADITLEDLGL